MGGLGHSPIASGTVGSVPAIVLWYFAAPAAGAWVWLGACVAMTLLSFVVAHRAGPLFGKTDAGEIVIDEVAGMMWTMILVPHGVWWAVGGFLAFRLFDITKPWPASFFDKKVKNGFGVTMDDIVAGWYACAVLHLVRFLMNIA